MRRMVVVIVLVLAALLVELAISQSIPDFSETGSATDAVQEAESKPFCQSVVMFSLPEKRWMAYVKHPNGGREALEDSLRLFPQDGMPDPLPHDPIFEHYEVLDTACFSWAEIFDVADTLYLGRAQSLLEEPDAPITIYDARRALMKLFFKEHWQEAEQFFPLR